MAVVHKARAAEKQLMAQERSAQAHPKKRGMGMWANGPPISLLLSSSPPWEKDKHGAPTTIPKNRSNGADDNQKLSPEAKLRKEITALQSIDGAGDLLETKKVRRKQPLMKTKLRIPPCAGEARLSTLAMSIPNLTSPMMWG